VYERNPEHSGRKRSGRKTVAGYRRMANRKLKTSTISRNLYIPTGILGFHMGETQEVVTFKYIHNINLTTITVLLNSYITDGVKTVTGFCPPPRPHTFLFPEIEIITH
jgi:hypothetical protein